MKRQGFTLAEVLITLGIIGVVAAMTIPTLIGNSQKEQYVVGLKKAYTQFNQALIQMTTDYNCTGDLQCAGVFTPAYTNQMFGDIFVKYFKVSKNCEINKGQGCFATDMNEYYNNTGTVRHYDSDNNPAYRFITADGQSFYIHSNQDDCGSGASRNKTFNMTKICGYVYIDVNGLKGPNYMGRDVFWFYITNGKGAILYPSGGIDDAGLGWWSPNYCNDTRPYGFYCGGRVQEEGWQMNY